METRYVEIYTREFPVRKSADPEDLDAGGANRVAVVAPANLGANQHDEVIFINRTEAEIEIYSPRRWSSGLPDPDPVTGATVTLRIPPGEDPAPGEVRELMHPPLPLDLVDLEDGFRYHVFAHEIGEFAVGDSPPHMTLPPPP